MPNAIANLPAHIQPFALSAFQTLTLSPLTRAEIQQAIAAISAAHSAIPVIRVK